MRVLVIGGTQFMGREIVRRLTARGHEVTVLHRQERHDLGAEVRNLQADRGDLGRVATLVSQGRFDAVFDIAYDWQKGTPASHVETAARSCGDQLQRYVFMSSLAVYEPGLDPESDPLAPRTVRTRQHKGHRGRCSMHGGRLSCRDVPAAARPRTTTDVLPRTVFWDRLLDGRPIILPDGGDRVMPWATSTTWRRRACGR